jgi:hypothetical protein
MTAFSGHHHRGHPRAAFGVNPFDRPSKIARRSNNWKRLRRLRRRNLKARQERIYRQMDKEQET